MRSDLGNMLRILQVLRDEGFVDALTDVERLVADVDDRLEQFDEMISLLEAKIEAAFSIGFFFFAIDRWTADDPFLALGLLFMGLLGASSLAVTVRRLPQVRRLRSVGRYATNRLDSTDDWLDDEEDEGKSK